MVTKFGVTRGGSPACVSWDSLGAKPLSAMLDAEAASPLNPLLPSLVVAFNMDETSHAFCVLVSLPMQSLKRHLTVNVKQPLIFVSLREQKNSYIVYEATITLSLLKVFTFLSHT